MSTQNPSQKQDTINPKQYGIFTNYIYKAIPLAFDNSMSYEQTLCGLLAFLENTVIPAVNDDITAVNELKDLYTELKNFVDHYFDNLDVQQEINNKLDAMVEDGTFEVLIAQYLNNVPTIIAFDNVQAMKTYTGLENGSFVKTLGYYSTNDGGQALYKIRTKTGDDIIDEGSILSLSDTNLIAELIIDSNTNIKHFGAIANGTNNDSSYAIAMLNKLGVLNLGHNTVVLQGITLPEKTIIKNGTIKVVTAGTPFTGNNLSLLTIDNVEFQATYHMENPSNNTNLFNIYDSSNILIKNCKINECACGFNFVNCENIIAYNNEVTGVSRFGFNFGTDNVVYGSIKNVQFYNNSLHDNTHIPLKFTGYLEDVNVYGNTGFNNYDSEETACYSFKNVRIHDNVFSNDTNRAIGFKQLDYTEYPLPSDAPDTLYAQDVEIYNNSCLNSSHNGINIQLYYDLNTKNILIHDNTVDSIGTGDFTGIRIGVLNSTTSESCKIYNNYVNLQTIGRQGILLVNANNVLCSQNTVLSCEEACVKISCIEDNYTAYSVKASNIAITDNILHTKATNTSRCVMFNATGTLTVEDISNVSILRNDFDNNTNANQIQDKSSTTVLSQNYDGVNLYDTTPSRRSANFTIFYAKDPVTAGCIGWIATGGISSPTYKQYIPIS